jgi:DNA adenine methylase
MHPVARINLKKIAPLGKTAQRPAATPTPVVKWAGGKTRLLEQLEVRLPGSYRRYFEPFMGGAAMFFRLEPADAVLNDCNADLVNMYRCVAGHVEAVIKRLARHKRDHSQEHYYEVRDRWNARRKGDSDVERAAAFIYLNKTCYNGLWRVNSKGGFNVPMGRYTDPPICDAPKLRAASHVLRQATLTTGHYADAVADAGKGDFVYFDPPYDPVSPTASFTSYTAGDFGADDQRALAELMRTLADRGAHVMLSNSDTPFVRKLYHGFRIEQVPCARAINSKASSRGAVMEVIVTNR